MPDVLNKFAAGSLLGTTKNAIRNTSIAITETSTPYVREVLTKQLNQDIKAHARIFNYMLSKGLYPSYNIDKVIQNDIKNANQVLKMKG